MGGILKFLGGSALGILNTIFSVFSAGMNGAMSLVKSAFQGALQYHQAGIEFARGMGMSLQQAQAYTTVLTERAADLGFKYGVAAEAVKELQQNLAEATGKAAMLNDVDAERFLQINKLVGSNVTKQFTSEIMNHLGGQIHTVEGAVSKAYATAAKSGLNAAQFSEKVAKNLSMANKLSFRNGINGIIKMTALSEKLGFNLQSVEKAAENFMEIDKAIENSAKLQMLGGAAGAYGSNPLTMAYEANYDPEAFTERMTKSLGGYAQFDTKTGTAKVNGMNRDFVKNIAQAMGISMDEAMSIAKKQAEIKYKESSGLADKVRSMNLSDEQKDYLINSSYIGKDGQLKMTDANGKERNVSEFTADELEKMMSLEGKSDEEIMRQQALTLTSINEKIEGLQTSAVAELAKAVNPHIDDIQSVIASLGNTLLAETRSLVGPMSNAIGGVTKFVKDHLPQMQDLIHTAGNFLGFIFNHWKLFLGIYAGVKILGMLGNLIGVFRSGFNLLSKGGGAVTRTARAAVKKAKVYKRWLRTGSKAATRASKIIKIGGGVGAAAISSISAGVNVNEYKDAMKKLEEELRKGRITQEEYNKQSRVLKDQKNEALGSGIGSIVGGVAGSFLDEFLGPFGTIIGATIGDFVGGFIGKSWNTISNAVSDFWTGPVREFAEGAFGKFGTSLVDAVSSIVDGITDGYGSILEGTFGMIGDVFSGIWEGIKTYFGSTWDGIVKIFHGDITGLFDIALAPLKGTWEVVKGLFNGVCTFIKGNWDAICSLFRGLWGGMKHAWEGVTAGFSKVGEYVGKAWDKVTGKMSSIWNSFKEGLMETIDDETKKQIKEAVSAVKEKWNDITEGVANLWNGAIQTISDGWNKYVAEPVSRAWTVASGFVSEIWTKYVAEPVANAWKAASTFVSDIWNKYVAEPIAAAWTKLTGWVTQMFSPIFEFFGKIRDLAAKLWDAISSLSPENIAKGAGKFVGKVANWITGNAEGGIVGGNSYSGDRVLTRVNSGEMILNAAQQSRLFNFISNSSDMLMNALNPFSQLTNRNDVKAKPVGEREYIYVPTNNNNASNGVTEVTVKDINLNINGTLKLDANSTAKNLDISKLLEDTTFISSLKDLIKQSINNDINNGRFMNDIASMRGMPSQVGLWGRK